MVRACCSMELEHVIQWLEHVVQWLEHVVQWLEHVVEPDVLIHREEHFATSTGK